LSWALLLAKAKAGAEESTPTRRSHLLCNSMQIAEKPLAAAVRRAVAAVLWVSSHALR